jgi:hypothetical protein
MASAKHIKMHLQSYMNIHNMHLAVPEKMLNPHTTNTVTPSYLPPIAGRTEYTCREMMQQVQVDGISSQCYDYLIFICCYILCSQPLQSLLGSAYFQQYHIMEDDDKSIPFPIDP